MLRIVLFITFLFRGLLYPIETYSENIMSKTFWAWKVHFWFLIELGSKSSPFGRVRTFTSPKNLSGTHLARMCMRQNQSLKYRNSTLYHVCMLSEKKIPVSTQWSAQQRSRIGFNTNQSVLRLFQVVLQLSCDEIQQHQLNIIWLLNLAIMSFSSCSLEFLWRSSLWKD